MAARLANHCSAQHMGPDTRIPRNKCICCAHFRQWQNADLFANRRVEFQNGPIQVGRVIKPAFNALFRMEPICFHVRNRCSLSALVTGSKADA